MFEDSSDHIPDESMADTKHLMRSIIKIYCHASVPNFSSPWNMSRPELSTSSGFVIDLGDAETPQLRILCNAHGIAFGSIIQVRRHGSTMKFHAKVAHVGHECDLALLTVDDAAFWHNVEPLEFGSLPELQERVMVLGYPTGGDAICVTEGVVSRLDVFEYAHSQEHLLIVQIDASINGGNSGGPAICDGRVVGVAFQSLEDAESIGYIIPIPVVKHFLSDVARGGYKGFPMLNVTLQLAENETLRQYKRIPPLSGLLQLAYPRAVASLRAEVDESQAAPTHAEPQSKAKPANTRGSAVSARACRVIERPNPMVMGQHRLQVLSVAEARAAAADAGLGDVEAEARAAADAKAKGGVACAVTDITATAGPGAARASSETDMSDSPAAPACPHQTIETPHGPMVPVLIDEELYYLQPSMLGLEHGDAPAASPPLPAPLRRYLLHPDSADAALGLIVASVPRHSASEGSLVSGDVLLTFDDTPLGSNNTVALRGRERVALAHLVSMRRVGDRPALLLLRDRKYLLRASPLMKPRQRLARMHDWSPRPAYLVALGLVLVPLSGSFLEAGHGAGWEEKAPVSIVSTLIHGTGSRKWADEEVVLLSHVLASGYTRGYEERELQRLVSVNGELVRNLKHAAELIAAAAAVAEKTEAAGASIRGDLSMWLRLGVTKGDEIVLDLRQGRMKHKEILSDHQVPMPGAAHVSPMWSDEPLTEGDKNSRKLNSDQVEHSEAKRVKCAD